MSNPPSSKPGNNLPQASSGKPWEAAKGGEGSQTDALSAAFVESLSYDTRLYAVDIMGSIAHARMLASVGLLTRAECESIEAGLKSIRAEIEAAPAGPTAVGVSGRGGGAWPGWKTELEDVHMCIEAALIEKIGDAGRKLHTGRSRNDQVALDLRLYLREACCDLVGAFEELADAFETLAREQGDTLIPSYTHMQRAQPACVGAEAMAWWCMFQRDEELFTRMSGDELGLAASPLGSGAIAGSLLPLDRVAAAKSLGLRAPTQSSIDATASRDEALDFLYACTRSGIHLSRWAEQWILYCSTEFGFLELAPEHTTGSSMMPQKRNPDMLELTRGRSGNLAGSLVALLTICKGLPIGYNRDLQEDKRHVFAAFDTLLSCLRMAARIVRGAKFNPSRISASAGGLDRGFPDATALAEYLVTRGVPFRSAHQVVGALVRLCQQTNRPTLAQLTQAEVNAALAQHAIRDVTVDASFTSCLGSAGVVAAYRTFGHAGTGTGGYKDWLAALYAKAPSSTGLHARATSGTPLTVSAPVAHLPVATVPSDAPSPASLFAIDDAADAHPSRGDHKRPDDATLQPLVDAYLAAARTLDDLPYTAEFETICAAWPDASGSASSSSHGTTATATDRRREVLRRLQNLRKAGKLPKLGKQAAPTSPPRISAEEEQTLADIVIEATGTLGQRDQLPYTPRFEAIVSEFNQRTARAMTPHDVWRLVAKLAK